MYSTSIAILCLQFLHFLNLVVFWSIFGISTELHWVFLIFVTGIPYYYHNYIEIIVKNTPLVMHLGVFRSLMIANSGSLGFLTSLTGIIGLVAGLRRD